MRFSPYPVPQRTGRSVSPLATPSGQLDVRADDASMETDREDSEDDLDFWGRDVRSAAAVDDSDPDEDEAMEGTTAKKTGTRMRVMAWSCLVIGDGASARA